MVNNLFHSYLRVPGKVIPDSYCNIGKYTAYGLFILFKFEHLIKTGNE